MATIRLPKDFSEFLKLLNSSGAEYLMIGGYAINYYGYSRSTGDLDLWVRSDRENASKVAHALHEFGFVNVSSNLKDLKQNKRASGRLKDLADLEELD